MFLAEVRLEHYAADFRRFGARKPMDLANFTSEELSEMGMSLLEQRRFEFAMREALHGRGEDRAGGGDNNSSDGEGGGSLRSDSIRSGGSFVSGGGSFKAAGGASFASGGGSFNAGGGGSFRSGGSFKAASFRSGGGEGSFRIVVLLTVIVEVHRIELALSSLPWLLEVHFCVSFRAVNNLC